MRCSGFIFEGVSVEEWEPENTFSTTFQSQYNDYDELGRLVCKIGYTTHGYLDYYYIYEDEGEKPGYCIRFDDGQGYTIPAMIVYRQA